MDEYTDEELIELIQSVEGLAFKEAREDFYKFVQLMADEVLEQPFEEGRHIPIICKQLMRLESGEIRRLMVFLPPRSMKSKLGTVLFPAWCLGRNLSWQVLALGRDMPFAINRFSVPVRDLMQSEAYQKVFPEVKFKGDMSTKTEWWLETKAKFQIAGAQKGIAGIGANLCIIDDIIHEQNVLSDTEIHKICEWYGFGVRQRFQPGARELIINTRWRVDDLSGYLLDKDEAAEEAHKNPWTVVSIPAIINTPEASKLMGLPEGSSYWPEMWSKEELLDKKAGMLPHQWASLYMQNPIPEEGSIMKGEWLQNWTSHPPDCELKILSLDTAFSTRETADPSAWSLWGVFYKAEETTHGKEILAPNAICLDCGEGRWEFPDLKEKTLELFERHKVDVILIEKKASGQSLIQELRRMGLPVMEYCPDKDKISRVHAVAPSFAQERVWFTVTEDTDKMKRQLLEFPFSRHDDLVDTCSQAILYMRDGFYLRNPDDWEDDEEDTRYYKPKGSGSYYSSLFKH